MNYSQMIQEQEKFNIENGIDYSALASKVGASLGQETELVKFATQTKEGSSTTSITEKQAKAISRFPSLVEILGDDNMGEDLAKKLGSVLNEFIADKILKNSRFMDNNVVMCKPEKGSIKQYYKSETKVGFVTAKGKFSGRECIKFDEQNNEVKVFVKEGKSWKEVTENFKLDFQFAQL